MSDTHGYSLCSRINTHCFVLEVLVAVALLLTRRLTVTCACSSRVRLFVTPWTVAHQAPLSMGLPRQEYWSELPFPLPGYLPTQGSNPRFFCFLHWQADSLPLCHLGSPCFDQRCISTSFVTQMLLNIHLYNKSPAIGVSFCKNPPVDNMLICVKCYPKLVTDVNSYNPSKNHSGKYCCYFHFTSEKTEARRREIIQGVSGRFEQGVWLLSARFQPLFLTLGYFPPLKLLMTKVVMWSYLLVYCLSASHLEG